MEYTASYHVDSAKNYILSVGLVGTLHIGIIGGQDIKIRFKSARADLEKLYKPEYYETGDNLEIRLKKHRNAIKASLGKTLSLEILIPKDYVISVQMTGAPGELIVDDPISLK